MKQAIIRKLTPGRATVRRWCAVGAVILIGVLGILIYRRYLHSFDIYDFSHLTPVVNTGERREFVPLAGSSVPNMQRAAENEYLALYVHPRNATIAVYDKRSNHIWHSSPLATHSDPIANPFERNVMNSILGLQFYGHQGRVLNRWSYDDATSRGQFELYQLPNGLAIRLTLGNLELGVWAMPVFIEEERFQTRVLDQIESASDRSWLLRHYQPSPEREGFLIGGAGIRLGANAERALRIFYEIGYTLEDLEYDHALAGYESERTLDIITAYMEFVLDGANLIVNVPLNSIEMPEGAGLRSIEVMRFFGAASMEDEGFILVPSGSGALIDFNNGKSADERFSAPVYGIDYLTTFMVSQNLQPVRLPVLGLNKGNAAVLAHIENGAALATVNADVAGRTNSFNYAWFNFLLRSSQRVSLGVPGNFAVNSLNIMQAYAYTGDITVRYHFLAGDNITLGDMAQAYQQHLVNTGALTPVAANGDRTFYLDIIGAADLERHTLGVPHMTLEMMTTFEQAHHILDILNAGDVNNIQLLLHGWLDGALNHYVATRVRPIRGLGGQNQMQELDARLQEGGGALAPVTSFALTNFNSRRFNGTFEAARDISGLTGVMTPLTRDMLLTRFSMGRNDMFYLVHPAVMPFHIDDFIPAFNTNVGLNSLALADLGCFLTESMYRRNPVDREHSRLIASAQMGRLGNEFSNLVIFGGNDYAIRHASHLVDIPLRADWFYIIDHDVPFYQMVMHGFVEFAGEAINIQPNPDPQRALLNSMATGASPRFMMTAQHTRLLNFSPHQRVYSTYYGNWVDVAVEHYRIFNEVYRNLRAERIVDFIVLQSGMNDSVTATVFSDGTRIYVNNGSLLFEADGLHIPPRDFVVVQGGARND